VTKHSVSSQISVHKICLYHQTAKFKQEIVFFSAKCENPNIFHVKHETRISPLSIVTHDPHVSRLFTYLVPLSRYVT